MRAFIFAAGMVLALVLPSAARADCVSPAPPHERLADYPAAFAGTVIGRTDSSIRFRVEHVVKGDLPAELELPNPLSTVALRLEPGERAGLFLFRDARGDPGSNDCLRTGYDDLIAAAVPPPCEPRGRVVGCGRPPRGRGVQIEARRRCLTVTVLPAGPTGDCVRPGFPASETHVILGSVGRVVFGAAAAGSQGVAVTYRRASGEQARRSAALISVRRPAHRRRLGLKRERLVWAVQLPRGATPIAAEHHGFGGTVTGTVAFED